MVQSLTGCCCAHSIGLGAHPGLGIQQVLTKYMLSVSKSTEIVISTPFVSFLGSSNTLLIEVSDKIPPSSFCREGNVSFQTPSCHFAQWAYVVILHNLLHNPSFCVVLFPLGTMFSRSTCMYTGIVASSGCIQLRGCGHHLLPVLSQVALNSWPLSRSANDLVCSPHNPKM